PGARQRLATGQIDIMVKPALALLRQRPRPLDHQRARYSDSWIGDIAHAVIAEIGRLGPAVSGTAGGGSHTSNDPCTLRPMPGAAIVSAGYGKDRSRGRLPAPTMLWGLMDRNRDERRSMSAGP